MLYIQLMSPAARLSRTRFLAVPEWHYGIDGLSSRTFDKVSNNEATKRPGAAVLLTL